MERGCGDKTMIHKSPHCFAKRTLREKKVIDIQYIVVFIL